MPVVVRDIALDVSPQRGLRREAGAVNQLRLERVEEGFHMGILVGPALRRALAGPDRAEPIAKGGGRIFGAAITMKDPARAGVTGVKGPIKDAAGQGRIPTARQRPREDAAGTLIEDHGEETPPAGDREIRDIADPDPIGAPGDPLAGQPIGMVAVDPMEAGMGAVDLDHPSP